MMRAGDVVKRSVLGALAPVLLVAAAATLPAAGCGAAVAPAPRWTYGLSFPLTRFGWKRSEIGAGYDADLQWIRPAVGSSIHYNIIRPPEGGVPLAISHLFFGSTWFNSMEDTGLGIAVGPSVFDNRFSILGGIDLYRRIDHNDTGLLMLGTGGHDRFGRRNVFLLFNFGIRLGRH